MDREALDQDVRQDMLAALLHCSRNDWSALHALGEAYENDPQRLALLTRRLLETLFCLMQFCAIAEGCDLEETLQRMVLKNAGT